MATKKKLNSDVIINTIKMLKELAKDKNQKLKGRDIMSFDDYQYEKINQCILNLKEET